jgi:hypothetical protein
MAVKGPNLFDTRGSFNEQDCKGVYLLPKNILVVINMFRLNREFMNVNACVKRNNDRQPLYIQAMVSGQNSRALP